MNNASQIYIKESIEKHFHMSMISLYITVRVIEFCLKRNLKSLLSFSISFYSYEAEKNIGN